MGGVQTCENKLDISSLLWNLINVKETFPKTLLEKDIKNVVNEYISYRVISKARICHFRSFLHHFLLILQILSKDVNIKLKNTNWEGMCILLYIIFNLNCITLTYKISYKYQNCFCKNKEIKGYI